MNHRALFLIATLSISGCGDLKDEKRTHVITFSEKGVEADILCLKANSEAWAFDGNSCEITIHYKSKKIKEKIVVPVGYHEPVIDFQFNEKLRELAVEINWDFGEANKIVKYSL